MGCAPPNSESKGGCVGCASQNSESKGGWLGCAPQNSESKGECTSDLCIKFRTSPSAPRIVTNARHACTPYDGSFTKESAVCDRKWTLEGVLYIMM